MAEDLAEPPGRMVGTVATIHLLGVELTEQLLVEYLAFETLHLQVPIVSEGLGADRLTLTFGQPQLEVFAPL